MTFLKHICCILFILLMGSSALAQISFSEIMYDVEGVDYHDEFIEVFNRSHTDTLDLSGWRLYDGFAYDDLISAGLGMLLPPRSYAVILDGSYFGNSTTYDEVIPDTALIIRIADNAFGRSGLPNTQARTLTLLDANGHERDAYTYTVGIKPGYSNEKINIDGDHREDNWGASLRKGGTPGFRNSIAPYEFDLALGDNAITYRPSYLLQTLQPISITMTISNKGLNHFQGSVNLRLFVDVNNDSIFNSGDEWIIDVQVDMALAPGAVYEITEQWTAQQAGQFLLIGTIVSDADQNPLNDIRIIDVQVDMALAPGAVYEITEQWTAQQAGQFLLIGTIASDADQNPLNDIRIIEFNVVESRETVKINEIKFLTGANEPEWVELVNVGDEPVSLRRWGIADLRDTVWIDSSVWLHPGQFKVFAQSALIHDFYEVEDSLVCVLRKLPVLNDASDVVYLINPAGGWIEQVPYSIDWLEGEDWRKPSLERIHYHLDSRLARNWGPSTAERGATPAGANSIFMDIRSHDLKVRIEPNPFSPDGDGFEDHTVISIEIPADAARLRLDVYDVLGRRVRSIRDNRFTGSRLDVVWDGRDDYGKRLRMGIYVIFVQILNDRDGLIREFKDTVVVAGKL